MFKLVYRIRSILLHATRISLGFAILFFCIKKSTKALRPARHSDEGLYMCSAFFFLTFSFLAGIKGSMFVPLGNAGLFARKKEYWYASNGDTVMIPCLAKDWSPFANISWHFRNEVGIERIIEEHASSMGNLTGQGAWRNPQADPTKPELLLVIPKFQHDQHSGYYTCRVENDVGSLQREILLAPRGEFQVISQSVGDWKLFWSIPH